MTLSDRLTEEERLAGLALLVHEHLGTLLEQVPKHVSAHRRRRARITLQHWIISRNLPIGGRGDLSAAIVDAMNYVDTHPTEVERFKQIRQMERRLNAQSR